MAIEQKYKESTVSTSDHTANYDLPLWESGDKTSWLEQVNDAMNKIDDAILDAKSEALKVVGIAADAKKLADETKAESEESANTVKGYDDRLKAVEGKTDEHTNDITELNERASQANLEIHALKSTTAKTTEDVATVDSKYDDKFTKLNEQLSVIFDSVNKGIDACGMAIGVTDQKVDNEVAVLHAEDVAIRTDLNSTNQKVALLDTKTVTLDTKIDTVETRMNDKVNTVRDDLSEDITTTNDSISTLANTVTDISNKLSTTTEKLTTVEAKQENDENLIERLSVEMNNAHVALATQSNSITNLTNTVTDIDTRVDALEEGGGTGGNKPLSIIGTAITSRADFEDDAGGIVLKNVGLQAILYSDLSFDLNVIGNQVELKDTFTGTQNCYDLSRLSIELLQNLIALDSRITGYKVGNQNNQKLNMFITRDGSALTSINNTQLALSASKGELKLYMPAAFLITNTGSVTFGYPKNTNCVFTCTASSLISAHYLCETEGN